MRRSGRPANCSSSSGFPRRRPSATRTSSRAACGSARPSPWRSPATRRCCWPTSPPRRSTSWCRRRSSQLLESLTADLGLALVLVTHDLPLVTQVCERAVVMYAGRIAEAGPVDTLFHDPRHPYTRLLFAATPDLSGVEEVVSIPGAPPRLDRPIVGCPFAPRCDRVFDPCASRRPRSSPSPSRTAACHLNDAATPAPSAPERQDERGRRGADPADRGRRCWTCETWSCTTRCGADLAAAIRREPHKRMSAVDGVSLLAATRARCSR